MQFFIKIGRLIAEYFAFFAGFLFIFVIGFIYALLKPQGIILNAIFLLIAIGWVVYLIKYFWELLEKNKK